MPRRGGWTGTSGPRTPWRPIFCCRRGPTSTATRPGASGGRTRWRRGKPRGRARRTKLVPGRRTARPSPSHGAEYAQGRPEGQCVGVRGAAGRGGGVVPGAGVPEQSEDRDRKAERGASGFGGAEDRGGRALRGPQGVVGEAGPDAGFGGDDHAPAAGG